MSSLTANPTSQPGDSLEARRSSPIVRVPGGWSQERAPARKAWVPEWAARAGGSDEARAGEPCAASPQRGPGPCPRLPAELVQRGAADGAGSASWVPSRPRGWGRGRGTEQSLGAGGRKPVAAETRAVRVGFSEPFRRIHRRVLLQTGSSRQSQRAPEMSRLVTFLLESRSAGQEVPPPLLR